VFGNDGITSIVRHDSEMARNEEIRTPDPTSEVCSAQIVSLSGRIVGLGRGERPCFGRACTASAAPGQTLSVPPML